jgi:Ser/Thr protein kinase RdoA (MazF antagonist)
LSRADGRLAPRVGLEDLAGHEYPAERCAVPDPVSELHDQAVIVTEHLDAVPRAGRREAIRQAGGLRELGAMLGRLTALPAAGGAPGRTGGSWHHLTDGGPDDELAALAKLLDASPPAEDEGAYRTLRDAVAGLDAGDGLPRALAHPDFVLANAVATTDGRIVMVDWAGAGTAPRVWPLAFLLWSVGFDGDLRRVDRVVAGYRHHVRLEPEELARLGDLIRARPVLFDAWAFATGRKRLDEAASGAARSRELAQAIADRARAAFRGQRPTRAR